MKFFLIFLCFYSDSEFEPLCPQPHLRRVFFTEDSGQTVPAARRAGNRSIAVSCCRGIESRGSRPRPGTGRQLGSRIQLRDRLQAPSRGSFCTRGRRQGSNVRHPHLWPSEGHSIRRRPVSAGDLRSRTDARLANQHRYRAPMGRVVSRRDDHYSCGRRLPVTFASIRFPGFAEE